LTKRRSSEEGNITMERGKPRKNLRKGGESKHTLKVVKFGPIEKAQIDVTRVNIYIGPQSSGKSTLSKLVFFFYHLRDLVAEHIFEQIEKGRKHIDWKRLRTRLRQRFVEFWGPTPQNPETNIIYYYQAGVYVEIQLERETKNNFYTFYFSEKAKDEIINIFKNISENYDMTQTSEGLFSSASTVATTKTRSELYSNVRKRLDRLFDFSKEVLFIPAGRSILSTLSEQLQYVRPEFLDYPMRQFIEKINTTKMRFNKSLSTIIEQHRATSLSEEGLGPIRQAEEIIKKILGAEYIHDNEGGKIYVDDKTYTKLAYASSGQQESVWILLSLFLAIMERAKALIFVEEPEAHLYPTAQKDVMDLIAFTTNSVGCDFVITTHSPYILAAVNNYVYAHTLSKRRGSAPVRKVIDSKFWVSSKIVNGYYTEDGKCHSILNEHGDALKVEMVDQASESINVEFENLLELEEQNR